MSAFLSWLLGKTAGLVRFLPNALLRSLYPVPVIRERLTVLTRGVGPHIFINPGTPARLDGMELIIFNRLPFPVEIEGLRGEISLESRILAGFDKVDRLVIPGGDIGRVWFRHDLTDSQVDLVRGYPEGQPPVDCPILRVNGELNVRTSFRALGVGFGVETRAFIYRNA